MVLFIFFLSLWYNLAGYYKVEYFDEISQKYIKKSNNSGLNVVLYDGNANIIMSKVKINLF